MPRIGDEFFDLSKLTPHELSSLPNDAFAHALESLLRLNATDRREAQLLRYIPASSRAWKIHESDARLKGVGGGNGSGKTETSLIEPIAMACGVFPDVLRDKFMKKFRGPIAVRVVVQSLTTTLDNVILPKLQWWKWTGVDLPGGDRGHWGWIPKMCLIDGSWKKSWQNEIRTLKILCRNPENLDEVIGESTIQFMSHDQNPADAASGDFHYILLDEPPKLPMFRECQARTMRVKGTIILAMTWPDDPTIPVDWIFDEIYEKGQPGPNKDPNVEWFELWTEENKNLDQGSVAVQASQWSETTKSVRLYGQPIRFSNRIHPLFTDVQQIWSVAAGRNVIPVDGRCPYTGSIDLIPYCHVQEFDVNPNWPVIFVLDPHPRKPHMYSWFVIDPADDIWQIAEGQCDGDPVTLRQRVMDDEAMYRLRVVQRLMDPNMGASPASTQRNVTWQSELRDAQLICDLGDDSDVGRSRLNEYLKVDKRRLQPRFHVHPRCTQTIFQIKRYVWDNYRRQEERDLKQIARDKYDDYPTIIKYLFNFEPEFRSLNSGGETIRLGSGPFGPRREQMRGQRPEHHIDRR